MKIKAKVLSNEPIQKPSETDLKKGNAFILIFREIVKRHIGKRKYTEILVYQYKSAVQTELKVGSYYEFQGKVWENRQGGEPLRGLTIRDVKEDIVPINFSDDPLKESYE